MFNRTLYNYFFIAINSSDTSICDSNDLNVYQPTYEYEKIINGKQGYILWGIVFVIIAFLGLIGNIFTIMVLKREAVVSTLNTLLIALAISDILAPMANVLLAISFYHLSIPYENSVNFLIFNDILRHFIQPLSTMFTMSSSWILTITTLFRLIAVMLPFKARTLINKRFAIICLFIIFGFGLISILPLYASLIRKIKCTKDNKIQYVAFDMEVTSEFMAKYYILMIQSLSFYLPWCLALILWLFLLKALKQSEKCFNVSFTPKDSPTNVPMLDSSKHHLTFAHNNHESSSIHSHIPIQNSDSRINNAQTRLKSYNRITLMVVVLTFTNLICRLFTFVFIFEVIYNEYLKSTYVDEIDEEVTSLNSTETNKIFLNSRNYFPNFLAYSLLLNNIFLCINHSCNIIIYTVTNPRFRKNLMALLRCGDPVKEYKQNFLNDKHLNSTLNRHTIALNETYFHNNVNTSFKRKVNKSLMSWRCFFNCIWSGCCCICYKYGKKRESLTSVRVKTNDDNKNVKHCLKSCRL